MANTSSDNSLDKAREEKEDRRHDAFEALCAAFSSRDLVAVLYAYFDESYNHRTQRNPHDPLLYTVACWLAPVNQWKKFGKKWKSALGSVGLEAFHMNEYENRRADYEDWPEIRRVNFLKRLHRIMKEHIIYGCSYTLDRAAFDELVEPNWKSAFGTKSCYGFAVFSCLDDISGWCEHNGYGDEKIHHVFAHMQGQGSDLDTIFNFLLKRPKLKQAVKLTGMWTKGLARDVPQLQAADILAYEVNKQATNAFGAGAREIRKSLQNLHLFSRGRFNAGYYGREQLAQMMLDLQRGKIRTLEQISEQLSRGTDET